jgi:hypothetical protein
MNKLAILKMSKKKIIGAVCAIALFAGGAVVGAQIYANAENNAIAVLPIAKGGTNANTAATAATNILGTNFGNYSGVLPVAKGGTGESSVSATTASLKTNYSATVNSIRRLGKTVSISLRVKNSVGWSNNSTIATIPEGYRPAVPVYATAGKAAEYNYFGNQIGMVAFNTDGGIVNFQPQDVGSAGANVYLMVTVSYTI